jgi:hypothetical protein
MRKTQSIWTAVVMTGFVMFSANMAFSETPSASGVDKNKAGQSDINKNDHGAGINCAPAGSSPSQKDQAVGNDSPLTKNSQSKKDEASAPSSAPCDQSAQPNNSISKGSGDKGAGTSNATPDNKVGPDNHVK